VNPGEPLLCRGSFQSFALVCEAQARRSRELSVPIAFCWPVVLWFGGQRALMGGADPRRGALPRLRGQHPRGVCGAYTGGGKLCSSLMAAGLLWEAEIPDLGLLCAARRNIRW